MLFGEYSCRLKPCGTCGVPADRPAAAFVLVWLGCGPPKIYEQGPRLSDRKSDGPVAICLYMSECSAI